MQSTLAKRLQSCLLAMAGAEKKSKAKDEASVLAVIEAFPAQLVLIATQILWTERVESELEAGDVAGVQRGIAALLELLAQSVLISRGTQFRQKLEQVITASVHQRDVVRELLAKKVANAADFAWMFYMRFSWLSKQEDLLSKLSIA